MKQESLGFQIELALIADLISRNFLSRNTSTSLELAIQQAQDIRRQLADFSERLPPHLSDLEVSGASGPLDLETAQGEQALLRLQICIHYHNLQILCSTPLLSYDSWYRASKRSAPPTSLEVQEIAHTAVRSAFLTVSF